MPDHVDVEMRVYLTGHHHGSVDWSVVQVHPDGQCEWVDGGSYRQVMGRAAGVVELDQAMVKVMNTMLFQAGTAQFGAS